MFSVAPVAPRLWWHDTSWRPWVGGLELFVLKFWSGSQQPQYQRCERLVGWSWTWRTSSSTSRHWHFLAQCSYHKLLIFFSRVSRCWYGSTHVLICWLPRIASLLLRVNGKPPPRRMRSRLRLQCLNLWIRRVGRYRHCTRRKGAGSGTAGSGWFRSWSRHVGSVPRRGQPKVIAYTGYKTNKVCPGDLGGA